MAANPRDMGFGLNYNQGFGTRGPYGMGGGGGGGGGGGPKINGPTQKELDQEKELAGNREKGETERSRIAADASTLAARLRQQRYEQMLPFAMGNYNRFAGGVVGPAPEISVGPIWDTQQIQQRINAGRAQNDQGTAGQIRDMEANLAGQGFGSRSPLRESLAQQAQMANMARNSDLERETRWDTAQGNKEHILDTQEARSEQFLGVEDIKQKRDQASLSGLAALLAAMI
jgi:hypothetical protein